MTTDIVSTILQWLNTHAEYSWIITFIISASESVAVIGTIIPGSITMIALGTLAGSGIIPLWSTLLWAFLGAIVGDTVSYAIGYHYRDRLRLVWPFNKNQALLIKGEKFFNRYGGMGVFIGRFIGPIRALIPLVAGMMGMKPLYFLIANVTSAAGWAPAYMLPGILIGAASLELPPDIATRVILILIFWTLFLLLCLWIIRKIPLFTHHQIIGLCNKLWKKLQKSKHWRVIRTIVRHHNVNETPLQLTLILYLFVMGAIFIVLATYINYRGSANIFLNQSIYHLFRGIFTNNGKDIMIYLTLLGQKTIVLPMAAIIIGWLFYSRRFHAAFHGLGLFLLTGASIVSIKYLIHSPRPWGIMQAPESFSFPSGHTTLTTTFYISLLLMMNHALSNHSRRLAYIFTALLVFIVAISRLYLGVHWFTDVLGGWILSSALLTLITISYNRGQGPLVEAKKLFMISLLALALIYPIVAFQSVPKLKASFTQLDRPIQEAEQKNWWNEQGSTFLPELRVSMFGFPSLPVNIEWVGQLADIEANLLKAGWKKPEDRDWIDVLFRLSGIQSAEHLPIISPLYLDKKPVLVLVKTHPVEKKLMVLRLWQSNIILKDNKQPLWVGVVSLVPRTYGWLSRHYKMDLEPTPRLIIEDQSGRMKIKAIHVTIPSKKKKLDQTILLIR